MKSTGDGARRPLCFLVVADLFDDQRIRAAIFYGLRLRARVVLRVVFFDFAGAAFVFVALVLVVAFVTVGRVVAGASGGSVAPPPLTQAFQPPSSGLTFVKPRLMRNCAARALVCSLGQAQ
jgi:hypothetical protein